MGTMCATESSMGSGTRLVTTKSSTTTFPLPPVCVDDAMLTGCSACDEEQALGIRNAFMLFYERVVDDEVYCEKQGYEQEKYEQERYAQEEDEDEGFGEGESDCPSEGEGEDGEKMDVDGGGGDGEGG